MRFGWRPFPGVEMEQSGKPPSSSPELLQLCWGSRSRAVTLGTVSGFTYCGLCHSPAPDCQDPFHLSHNACTDCRLNSSPEAYFFPALRIFYGRWPLAFQNILQHPGLIKARSSILWPLNISPLLIPKQQMLFHGNSEIENLYFNTQIWEILWIYLINFIAF